MPTFKSQSQLSTGLDTKFPRSTMAGQTYTSPEEKQDMTQRLFNTTYNENRNMNVFEKTASYAAAIGLDLIDTAASSMPGMNLINPRGQVFDLVGDYGGEMGKNLENFYTRNQAAVELSSGVIGAVATGYLAGEVILPQITNRLAASTMISSSKLWQSGAGINAAVRAGLLEANAAAAADGMALRALHPAKMKYMANAVTRAVGKAAFEEAAVVVAMNQNSAIVSDEMSDNILFAGMGLVAGGAFGAIATRFEMRMMANSEEMLTKRLAAIDPQGITALREDQSIAVTQYQLSTQATFAKESAATTGLALEWRQVIPEDATPAMRSRAQAAETQAADRMNISLQKQTVNGVEGVGGTKFSVAGDTTEGLHLKNMLYEKPMGVFGLDSIGSYKANPGRQITVGEIPRAKTVDPIVIQARKDFDTFGISDPKRYQSRVKQISTSGAQGDLQRYQLEVKRLADAKKARNKFQASVAKMTPAAQLIETRRQYVKELMASGIPDLIQQGRRLEKQQPLGLVHKTWMPVDENYYAFSAYEHGRVKLTRPSQSVHDYNFLDETGKKIRVNDKFNPVISSDIKQFLQTNEAMIQVFNNMVRSKQVFGVPAKPTWYQLDSAIEYERRGGKVDWKNSGITNSDEAVGKSLALKKKEITDKNVSLGDYWTRLHYNLPLPDPLERIYDAAGDGIRAVLDAAELGASTQELKALRSQMLNSGGFKVKDYDPSLTADMFAFNLDDNRKWRDSPIGFFDNTNLTKTFGERQLQEQLAEIKAERINTLVSGDPSGGMVPDLVKQLVPSQDFQLSTKVAQLADDQVTGVGGVIQQASGEILTREFRYRDNPTMLALLRVREAVSRMTNGHIEKLMKDELGDIQARLNAAPAASSSTLLKQFLSNKSGWDVEKITVMQPDGMHAFKLADTFKNQTRMKAAGITGDMLVNPRTGKLIVLDNLGMEYMQRYNRITDRILADSNRIRRSMGLDEMKHQNFYTPPPDTAGKHIAFTFDSNRKPVPGGGLVANSAAELEKLIAKRNETLPADQVILTRKAVGEASDLYDKAMMDWINPGTGPAPALGSTGTLSSDLINQEAIGDSLTWVKRQAETLSNNTLRVLYDSPLSIARARASVENATRSLDKSPLRTIFDEYEATLLGRSFQDMDKSISGRISKPIEQTVDLALGAAWPALRFLSPTQIGHWYGDLAQKLGVKQTKARTFEQLADQLGPHTPYKDATDYAEQTLKVMRPPEVKEISQNLNRLSAAVMLRWFEIPHAAMNLIGIMTTMPSIVRSGKAPVTMYLTAAQGKVGVVDSYRILASAMKDMVNKRSKLDWEHMVKNGDTTQQAAEFNVQMASVENRGTWGRVFLGDPGADKSTLKGKVKSKGVDGMISLLTDTSENMSRTYSHFVGLQLAKYHGITEMEARHSFAREVANAAIANYNPVNRPELYQSAFGSMFGLFMSYMQNYNQRLFRWMEQGDYANVGRQLAWQSSLFGVASLPGYKQVESLLLNAGVGEMEDGSEATMTDHIYAKFGPGVGSMLAHGSLDQLGVVLYTRGDMNYRDVSLNPAQLMAGLGVLTQGFSAVSESAQAIASVSQGEDIWRLSEVLARNMPNRAMKGMMTTLLNDGLDIDKRGQVVSENRTLFETGVRMLGLRSSRQQAEINAFYANSQMQEREAARMDVLRIQTRARIRQPGWESRMQETFDEYVQLGGRPDHFRTWIKDQVRAAQSSRGMNDLMKAMKNPKNQDEVWRYNAYGAN